MESPSTRNLYFAATVACLTGTLFGYSVGFIGGILVLPSFMHHFHLDSIPKHARAAATAGTITTWLIGTLFGVPIGMYVCSRWGRKACLGACAFVYLLGATVQVGEFGGSLAAFDAGRWINGVGVGAGTLVSPM
jgi:MFS family permease